MEDMYGLKFDRELSDIEHRFVVETLKFINHTIVHENVELGIKAMSLVCSSMALDSLLKGFTENLK